MSLRTYWVLSLLFVGVQGHTQAYNFNIGSGPGFPLGYTNRFANISYNFVTGGGVNLSPHVKINSEFMFHGIPVQKGIVEQLGFSDVKGRLYALSGNVLIGGPIGHGKTAYLIGGGGWYRRTLEAKQTVFHAGTVCSPYWSWWGEDCLNGIFAKDLTVGSRTSSAPGINVGGGLTSQLGDSPAHIYIEVRYHLAYTRNVHTEVLPLTLGVRF